MKTLEEYGRSIDDRIKYLFDSLADEEKKTRIISFMNLYQFSTGGSFDMNGHTKFFHNVNEYSLVEIDKVFFNKYQIHIVSTPQQLGLDKF